MNQFIKPALTGFRLILVVLLSVFAVATFAADCKVNDSDISGEYVGDCVNGLAHGKGRAKGRDTYEGEFKQGKKHGDGKYVWPVGPIYQGSYFDDRRNGFGTLTIPRSVHNTNNNSGKGKWIGDSYVETGMFEHGNFLLSCTSLQNCKEEPSANFGSTYVRKDLMCNNPKYYADPQGPGHHYSNFQLTPAGTAIDPRTGLEWRRCLVGQTFTNGICSKDAGKKTDYVNSFKVASEDRTGGYTDWRIPQFTEVQTLATIGCQPKVNPAIFSPSFYPSGDFWWAYFWVDFPTLTSNQLNEMERDLHPHAYVGYYSDDSSYHRIASRRDSFNLRLVRGGSADKYGHFTNLLATANDITAKRVVVAQEKLDKEILEQKRYAAEKAAEQQRIAAEEKKFQAILNDKNPQTIYLAAGAYERNGEGGKASQIYETIIAKFPSSSWAVKANDQLNETKRSSDAQSAANQRQYNAQRASESAAQDAASKARSQCSYRIDKCEDSCRPLSGSSKSACWSSCKSLCNQF